METHVSTVFLVGDRAYKLKKAIATGFLDWSTEASRRQACEREVELNSRLAPDVYQGVAAVLGPDGQPCDHLVVMRRLPEQARLSRLVTESRDPRRALRRVVKTLAAFHGAAARSPEIDEGACPDAVLARWRDNAREMGPYAGTLLDPGELEELADRSERYVAGRRPLFGQRIDEGRVCDGHGDLLADDIFCLPDGPRIVDCLEFDDRLRHGDVVEDIAFLAMDLERLGAPDLATWFLDAYRRATGDPFPRSYADFFVAYRAQVRAKVACLRHAQGVPAAAGEAGRLLGMALAHLRAAEVRLILVGGLPGSGKTTVARRLGHALGWRVLSSDEVRRAPGDGPEPSPAGAAALAGPPFATGRYTPAATDAAYEVLLDRARALLESGEPVILDASWTAARHRAAAAGLAGQTVSALGELRCEAPIGMLAHRIAERRAAGRSLSEATPEVMHQMALREDPWPTATAIDTARGRQVSLQAALAAVGANG